MLKKVLAGTAVAVMIASLSPVITVANNMGNGGTIATTPSTLQSDVTINEHSGEITLYSPGAVNESVTTLRLNLTSDEEFEFDFCPGAENKFDIYYANNVDSKNINIYIYRKKQLFDENSAVVIGNVSNPAAVKAEIVEYVSGNCVITLDNELRTYFSESDGVEEKFQNLNYSLVTTETTTTITTTTTTTTTEEAVTTTTEEAVATTTEETTTTTTEEATTTITEETTTTTTEEAVTTTTEETTTTTLPARIAVTETTEESTTMPTTTTTTETTTTTTATTMPTTTTTTETTMPTTTTTSPTKQATTSTTEPTKPTTTKTAKARTPRH
ncbi:MAG: hypothetical protein K2O60_07205, partial [Ruminococcus sp.]|nr:hypothetical protein [Ruminococcus sp.]